jgi:hypothetical protein
LTVNASSRKDSALSTQPYTSAAAGATRPDATGRSAVRFMRASTSRSYQWLTAPAPPADR